MSGETPKWLEDGKPEDIVLKMLGLMLHKECKDYAVNHMLQTDFILAFDAYGKLTKDIQIIKDDKIYTIKNSCVEKYNEYYDQKLERILTKFCKDNT